MNWRSLITYRFLLVLSIALLLGSCKSDVVLQDYTEDDYLCENRVAALSINSGNMQVAMGYPPDMKKLLIKLIGNGSNSEDTAVLAEFAIPINPFDASSTTENKSMWINGVVYQNYDEKYFGPQLKFMMHLRKRGFKRWPMQIDTIKNKLLKGGLRDSYFRKMGSDTIYARNFKKYFENKYHEIFVAKEGILLGHKKGARELTESLELDFDRYGTDVMLYWSIDTPEDYLREALNSIVIEYLNWLEKKSVKDYERLYCDLSAEEAQSLYVSYPLRVVLDKALIQKLNDYNII